jgi:hypothetical protein
MEIPESTACTSRSMASAFTRGDIKNWENLREKNTINKSLSRNLAHQGG